MMSGKPKKDCVHVFSHRRELYNISCKELWFTFTLPHHNICCCGLICCLYYSYMLLMVTIEGLDTEEIHY